jgi:hypothetical protein
MAAVSSILLLFLTAAPKSYASTAICSPLDKMLNRVVGDLHYAYLATAITDDNIVLNFYINQDGTWLVIMIDSDLNSCILAHGYDWQFALERAL